MNKKIERKLRLRFILIALAAILALQGVTLVLSIFLTYRQMTLRSDALIDMIEEDKGAPELGDARYFEVWYRFSDRSFETDLSHTKLVKRDGAIEYARKVLDSRKTEGYLDAYRYRVYRGPDEIGILFLSRKTTFENYKNTSRMLTVTSLIGTAVAAVVLTAVSGVVVRPILKNRQKQQEFITAAGHELKTPLTVIGADAQLLEEEIGENEWLSDIRKQTDKLTEMTQRLVLLARSEEDSAQKRQIDFPISDVAEDVADSYRAIAQSSGKPLRTELTGGLTYHGDETAIREMMNILLDNAFKYSSAGGTVAVSLTAEHRTVRFTVENPVDHLDPEALPHFTERFYRSGDTPGVKGHGIGLSVAKAVAENHRGKLLIRAADEKTIRITAILR